jgi:hypothetical protein
MRAGEADAPDAIDCADRSQELSEQRAAPREIAAIGVDVLPEQRHLGDPALGEQIHLGHDVGQRPADLGPAHGGHDAEGAGVVAPRLNVHPGRVGQLAHRARTQQRVGCRFGRRRVEDLHDRALGAGPTQKVRRTGEVVCPEDDVDPPHLLLDELAVLLGQAAPDGDLQTGSSIHQLLETPERAVESLVCVLPDAAGVEDHDIGLFHGGGGLHAVRHQEPGQALRVVFVHLAPERADEIALRHCRSLRNGAAYDSHSCSPRSGPGTPGAP